MSDILTQLLSLLVPFVVALISKYGWDLLEKLLVVFERMPSVWKPLAVAVVAWAIGLAANALQVQLPGDLHVWTPDTVHTLVAALIAAVLHLATKKGGGSAGAGAPGARVSANTMPPRTF